MPSITVITRDGGRVEIEGRADQSVMQNIRDAGIGELLAICGGNCSCATCHVYVDPRFAKVAAPMSEDENDLLDGLSHRQPDSRLSCQLRFTEDLAGLIVTIAPDE